MEEHTDIAARLVEELVSLRRGEGLSRSKLAQCETLITLPCVVRRAEGDHADRPTTVGQRTDAAMRLLTSLLPDSTNPRTMALRNAYALGLENPGNLTDRREAFAHDRGVKLDTVRNWEKAKIRDLALHLIGLGMNRQVEPSGPRPPVPSRLATLQRGYEAYEIFTLTFDRLYRYGKGRVLSSVLDIHTVEALIDGVTGFMYASRYTGGSRWVSAEAIDGGQVSIGEGHWTDDHSIVRIEFERPLLRGEQHRVIYRLNVDPTAGPAEPYAAKTTRHPTHSMTLRIQFCEDEVPKVVKSFSSQVGYDPQCLQPLAEFEPVQGKVIQGFLDPPLGFMFGFDWTWPEDD